MFDATSTFFVVLSFSVRLSLFSLSCPFLFFFFFNDTATTEIYTLSLHDALPISTLGTDSSPRMRRADIEVPNHPVDMDSWGRSACYPRGTFYPLSDGASTSCRRITSPDFRPCSTRQSHSQAPLCTYTHHLMTNHAEGTFGRLRYSLGGNRPS